MLTKNKFCIMCRFYCYLCCISFIFILLPQSGNGSIDYLEKTTESEYRLEFQQDKALLSSRSCVIDKDIWTSPSKELILCNYLMDICESDYNDITSYCSTIFKHHNPDKLLCILNNPYSFLSENIIPDNIELYSDYTMMFASEAKKVIFSINFIIMKHFQNPKSRKLTDSALFSCKSSNLISSDGKKINSRTKDEVYTTFEFKKEDDESYILLVESWVREMSRMNRRKLSLNKLPVDKHIINYDVNIIKESQNIIPYSPPEQNIDYQKQPRDSKRKSTHHPTPSPIRPSAAPSELHYYDDDEFINSGSGSNGNDSSTTPPSLSPTPTSTQSSYTYSESPSVSSTTTTTTSELSSNSDAPSSTPASIPSSTLVPTTPTSSPTSLPTTTITIPPNNSDVVPSGLPSRFPSPVYQLPSSSPTLPGLVGKDWWYLTTGKCWLWGLHDVRGILNDPNSGYTRAVVSAVEYAFAFVINDDLSEGSGGGSSTRRKLIQSTDYDSSESSIDSNAVVVLATLCVSDSDLQENVRLTDATFGPPISFSLYIWSSSDGSPQKIKLEMVAIAMSPELLIGLLHEQGVTDARRLQVEYHNTTTTPDPPPVPASPASLYDSVGNIAWVIGGTVLLFVTVVCTVGGLRFYCGKLGKRLSLWMSNSSRYHSFQTNSDLDEFKLDDDEVTIELHNI